MIPGATPLAKWALAKSPVTIPGSATASITLDALAASIVGTVDIFGTASITLDGVSLSTAAGVDIVATSAITLDALTPSAAYTVNDDYALSVTLDGIGLTASYFAGTTLEAAITLDGLGLVAEFTAPGPVFDASITLSDLFATSGGIDIELRGVAKSSIGGGLATRASVTAGHQLRTQAGSQRMRAY